MFLYYLTFYIRHHNFIPKSLELIFLRKILFVLVILSASAFRVTSQIALNWKPAQVRINESNASLLEKDSILNFFIETSKRYFTTSLDSGKTLIEFDSLFPSIQK